MKRMYIDNPLRVLSATGTIPEGVPACSGGLGTEQIFTFRFRRAALQGCRDALNVAGDHFLWASLRHAGKYPIVAQKRARCWFSNRSVGNRLYPPSRVMSPRPCGAFVEERHDSRSGGAATGWPLATEIPCYSSPARRDPGIAGCPACSRAPSRRAPPSPDLRVLVLS
jgi:hypothetical protein